MLGFYFYSLLMVYIKKAVTPPLKKLIKTVVGLELIKEFYFLYFLPYRTIFIIVYFSFLELFYLCLNSNLQKYLEKHIYLILPSRNYCYNAQMPRKNRLFTHVFDS